MTERRLKTALSLNLSHQQAAAEASKVVCAFGMYNYIRGWFKIKLHKLVYMYVNTNNSITPCGIFIQFIDVKGKTEKKITITKVFLGGMRTQRQNTFSFDSFFYIISYLETLDQMLAFHSKV